MFKKERRKFPRIDTDVTVEVYSSSVQTDDPAIAEICSVSNLSETGMCFITTHHFHISQLLRLTFLIPESIIIIRTDGTIVHLHRNKHIMEVGVCFNTITMSDRKLIRHYINKYLTHSVSPLPF